MMNRRRFLRNLAGAAAGAMVAPYILPKEVSLFAQTGSRKVNHVVYCMLAGGIRNIESVRQEAGGNLFPNLLSGAKSDYNGLIDLPSAPGSLPLQQQGTLFKEFRYAQGPTGHFNGHVVAMTGVYTDTGLNLRQNPDYPTIFEYYRKHNSPNDTPLNAWWIADSLGPYPALNYSKYPGYGSEYGANFIAPNFLFSPDAEPFLGDPKQFAPDPAERAALMRDFLNKNFQNTAIAEAAGVRNSPEEAEQVKQFLNATFDKVYSGQFGNPLGLSGVFSGDIYNVAFAEEVLKTFTPELTVVNLTASDVCHRDFTQYLNNMMLADYAVAHLWNTIQSIPEMANDTVMIIAPEHGRNLYDNGLVDAYGRKAIDHTSDPTSREIFCMVVGPAGLVNQGQEIGTPQSPVGESIDIIPTIAWLLGFDQDLPGGVINGRVLQEAFA